MLDRPADGEARVDGGGDGVPEVADWRDATTPAAPARTTRPPTTMSARRDGGPPPAASPPTSSPSGHGIGHAAEVENLLAVRRLIVTIHDPLIGVVLAPGQPD